MIQKNNTIVNLIKSGLKDLEEGIKKMSENEIKNENLDDIVEIVERIIEFNEEKQQGKA